MKRNRNELIASQLLAKCTTITNSALEKTHLVKVLPRFEKRGNERTAELAKKITAEAEKVTKLKGEAVIKDKTTKDVNKESIKIESASSPKPKPEPVTGIKRQREGTTTTGQPAKKINSGSPPASNTVKPATASAKRVTLATNADIKATTSTVVAPKAKGQQVQAKPSSFFSSLQSAAKRPGTGKASTVSVFEKDKNSSEKKIAAPTAASALTTAKPVWSFAETMANLNKSKEPESTSKPKPNLPPETPEERTKRLRKEERRKLRVSFKPEASLMEVRVFERQDEELTDRDNNVRDVDDKGGEGRMFKQHMDTVDLEDEDDYTPQLDEPSLIEFWEPSNIDFSDINETERDRNYAPYGGGELSVESPESKIQEQHERDTLMVFYADRTDIPPCPREPTDPYTGEMSDTIDFGQPPPQVLQRAEAARNTLPATQSSTPIPDVSALLKAIGGIQPQQQPQVPPQREQDGNASSASTLENIFAKFASPVQQLQPQQAQMQAAVQPPQPTVNPQLQAILASMQGPNPAQQPLQRGQQPVQSNLATLLQQIQQPAGQTLNQSFGASSQYGTPQQPSEPFENPERKRWREEQDATQGSQGNQSNQGNNNKRRRVDVSPFSLLRFY